MNLMINGIEAMNDGDGSRELTIRSQRAENGQIAVSVSDTRGWTAVAGGQRDFRCVLHHETS